MQFMNTDSKTDGVHGQDGRHHRYHDTELSHKAHVNVVIFVVTAICAIAYLVWAFIHVDYEAWFVVVPYLVAEVICFGSLLIWSGMMMHRREHPPGGLPLKEPPPPVDVVVTCCGEPLRVIEKTLRAAAKIDYPDFKVTVADDKADPEVGQLCEELGFTHLCRPEHEDRKAGNLNYAFTHTTRPFMLVLDSDQIPHHTILHVLIGYFSVPKIGFVTTYQGFDVPHGDPWGNRDRVFYGAMQPAKNDSNSAISCGTGVVYRRAALEEVGGFSTWNLVEDLYTSLLMHAAGWKSVYHPFPLTHGTAPMEIISHVKQRWQWAVDSLRLFFWRNPMLTKGLSWRQKLSYTGFGYNYLVFGIAYPIFFLIPVWGLFSDRFFFDSSVLDFVIWRAPYAVAYFILNRMLTDKRHDIKTFRAQIGLFQTFMSAILTALFSHRHMPRYKVNPKLARHPGFLARLAHVSGHLVIILLSVSAMIYGWFVRELDSNHFYVNAAWALWVVWLLLPFTFLALKPVPDIETR